MTLIANHDFHVSEAEFRQISDVVKRHCGIDLHDGKKELVRARMARRLRAGGFSSVAEYLERVRADRSGQELTLLIDAVSTNLTSFFREPDHFQHLRETFLPTLIDRDRANRRFRIRGWSAGCSSGEEAYSMAMVLHTALDGDGAWDAKILATDISTRMMEQARSGAYQRSRLGNLPSAMLWKYFVTETSTAAAEENTYHIAPALRRLISFRRLNLMDEPWPFSGSFDFIFCRNVMIYFDQATQERLIARYWDRLESGGLLFTGRSESLTGISHRFKYVEPSIYEKP